MSVFEMIPPFLKIGEQTFNYALIAKNDVQPGRWQEGGMGNTDHLTVQDDHRKHRSRSPWPAHRWSAECQENTCLLFYIESYFQLKI